MFVSSFINRRYSGFGSGGSDQILVPVLVRSIRAGPEFSHLGGLAPKLGTAGGLWAVKKILVWIRSGPVFEKNKFGRAECLI